MRGFIAIDYFSLDEDNKRIYHEFLEVGVITKIGDEPTKEKPEFDLIIPFDQNTSEDFSSRMLFLAQ